MSVWLRAGALVAAVMLSLSGCGGFHAGAPSTAGPCEIVPNGTPAPKTPPATVPSSRNLATNPEIATGYRRDMTVVRTAHYAAATANPLATQVACRVLRDGGTAADAVVAAQAVLGLVEPQSSGIGGGGYLVYFDARTGSVQAYDGREVAPAAATENYLRWVSDVDRSAPRPNARASGRSIGVPGILRMLESSPKPAGTRLTNPAYSKTLSAIASAGANAFYSGDIAHDIVAAASDTSNGRTPGLLTIEDLAGYLAKRRQPLCTTYRGREICGMPSSGGVAVAATLGILEHFPMSDYAPSKVDLNGGRPTVMGVHLIAEAERLAYADRDQYIADVDFVRLPGGSLTTLVDPGYLAARAALISPQHSMGSARPGDFGAPTAVAPPVPEHGTSHLSVVDSYGNAATLTTTVESSFGSYHLVDGFILNNQLSDFSAEPHATDGSPVANRVEPGKRPRSSMAPTLVFDHSSAGRGALYAVLGSPGGSMIIQFVVKTLVAMLDWGLNPQQAVSLVDFGAANSPHTNLGGENPEINTSDDGDHDPLVQGLRALGHRVNLAEQSSGLSAITRSEAGWAGGADPRREGAVMGDDA